METWGVGLGRWFGVEVRLHGLSLLLLTGLVGGAAITGQSPTRALLLWLFVLGAVLLREGTRLLLSLGLGVDLRRVLLTPLGGLSQYTAGRAPSARVEGLLGVGAILTNLLAGGTLFALARTFSPTVQLLPQPWISPVFLLRSLIWSNLLLGALHLLPAVPLDAGCFFRALVSEHKGAELAARAANGLSRLFVVALLLTAFPTGSVVLSTTAALLFLNGTLDRQTSLRTGAVVDSIRVRDVMLEDFFTLSSADTLEDALHRALHASQDVFPVVRGGSLVGTVSRRRIVDAVERSGNGFVQGLMTREVYPAHPDDRLLPALDRIGTAQGAQLVPVVRDGRVVGIVTPQNLSHSGRLLASKRHLQRTAD